MNEQARMPRRGRLKNGNPPGDPNTAPRCGAKTRKGHPCLGPKVRGCSRCRLHGGKSTGPRTPEGLDRCRKASWKHGARSKEVRELLRANRQVRKSLRALLA